MSTLDIIIDLETLSLRRTAAIATIGAVAVRGQETIGDIYLRVDIQSAIDAGGAVDAGTVAWWLRQSDDARAEIHTADDRHLILTALLTLDAWIHAIADGQTVIPWGNGAGFDLAILAEAYAGQGLTPPWQFWNERDLRTALDLAPGAKALAGQFQGIKHHALHDARHEALLLIAARATNTPNHHGDAS